MKMNPESQVWYAIARRIALVTAVFALLLSVLLILNYIQTKSVDPLNSKALNQLMLQLKDNPNDEAMKEQIRALDLLARKACFTHLWQVRIGGYMLFSFVVLLLLSLKYMSWHQARHPGATGIPTDEDSWENRTLARRVIIFSGLGLFVFAIVVSFITKDEFAGIGVTGKPGAVKTISPGNGKLRYSESAPQGPGSVTQEPSGGAESYPSLEEMRKNWPNFRGPEGIGVSYSSSVPTQWDGRSGKNILWKREIPVPGFNSPIVWGKKIFLSGADQKNQIVYCIDADIGAILWQSELSDIPGSPKQKPENTPDTGLAAPTMATDGVRVFVLFCSGDVAALDMEGKRIWAKNIGVPENHYGHASSLITFRDLLLIQYDQDSGGHLIALAVKTGNPVYDQRRNNGISWASPILVNTGNRFEIILNSNPEVVSHDPSTGKELWRVDCMSGEVAPSLAYTGGMVFAVNANAKLAAITLNGVPKVLWESKDDLSEVSSPLAVGDCLFVATSYGTVSCFDTKTGQRPWFQDLPTGFFSSPILAGNNVYLMNMDGTMYIFKAGKKYELVNTCELGEKAVTIPAFMPGRIYIRGFKNLFCIGQ